jgi:predicted acyl esterase
MDDKGLSYTSAPLARAMKLVGYPVVRLKVSADKPDANVFVYLDEVAADGKVEVVSFGRLALSHRKLVAALTTRWACRGICLQRDAALLPVGQQADLAIDLTPRFHGSCRPARGCA